MEESWSDAHGKVMLEELLCSLLGWSGCFFSVQKSKIDSPKLGSAQPLHSWRITVETASGIPRAIQDAAAPLLTLGSSSNFLRSFLDDSRNPSCRYSWYWNALAGPVEVMFQVLNQVVVALLESVRTDLLGLDEAIVVLTQLSHPLRQLHLLILNIQVENLVGGQVISRILREKEGATDRVAEVCDGCLGFCHKLFRKQIRSWVLDGVLRDSPAKEFFISGPNTNTKIPWSLKEWSSLSVNKLLTPSFISPSSAESLLFAGRVMQLLQRGTPADFTTRRLDSHEHSPSSDSSTSHHQPSVHHRHGGTPRVDDVLGGGAPKVDDEHGMGRLGSGYGLREDLEERFRAHGSLGYGPEDEMNWFCAAEAMRKTAAKHLWQFLVCHAQLFQHLQAFRSLFLLGQGAFAEDCLVELLPLITNHLPNTTAAERVQDIISEVASKALYIDMELLHKFRFRLEVNSFPATPGGAFSQTPLPGERSAQRNFMSTPMSNPMSNSMSNSMSNPMSNPMSNSMSNSMSNPMSNSMSNPMSNSMSTPMRTPIHNPMSTAMSSIREGMPYSGRHVLRDARGLAPSGVPQSTTAAQTTGEAQRTDPVESGGQNEALAGGTRRGGPEGEVGELLSPRSNPMPRHAPSNQSTHQQSSVQDPSSAPSSVGEGAAASPFTPGPGLSAPFTPSSSLLVSANRTKAIAPYKAKLPWNALVLDPQLEMPLQLVLSLPLVAKYNSFYAFLLELKGTSFLCENALSSLRKLYRRNRSTAIQPEFKQWEFLLLSITQFLTLLQTYCFDDVISTRWADFLEETKKHEDFDKLVQEHDRFLSGLQRELLLEANKRGHVNNLFVYSRAAAKVVEIHCNRRSRSGSDGDPIRNASDGDLVLLPSANCQELTKAFEFQISLIETMAKNEMLRKLESRIKRANFSQVRQIPSSEQKRAAHQAAHQFLT